MNAEEKKLLDEKRKAVKSERMKEKMLRLPLNDVILQVQDGVISINDVIGKIEEGLKNGRK